MPLTRKSVEEIRRRQKEIHWILLDFFKEHPGEYFTEEEIAKETNISKDEDEFVSQLLSMVIRVDYGDVDMLKKDGKTYFGKGGE